MKSMTGFGQSKADSSNYEFEVTVRSVNGRFLEIRTHISRELLFVENDLKKLVEKYLHRGTVDLFISMKAKNHSALAQVKVNAELAKSYQKSYKLLAKNLKLKTSSSVENYARLPEVIEVEKNHSMQPEDVESIKSAVEKACQSCVKERAREGVSLQKEIVRLLTNLQTQVSQIEELRTAANEHLKEKFEQKIKAKLQGVDLDWNRLAQEITIQIEKSDIDEELTRLKEHLRNYHELSQSTEVQGKKLDFYTQELLREVNTIGSKSNISKLTQIVVEAKTYIEKLREQVQNIE